MWIFYQDKLVSTSTTDRKMWVGKFGGDNVFAVFIEDGPQRDDGAAAALIIARGTMEECKEALATIVKVLAEFENVMSLESTNEGTAHNKPGELVPESDTGS